MNLMENIQENSGVAVTVNEAQDLVVKKGPITLRVKKMDGEWMVAWMENNKFNDSKSYYAGGAGAEEKMDAIKTMQSMASKIK